MFPLLGRAGFWDASVFGTCWFLGLVGFWDAPIFGMCWFLGCAGFWECGQWAGELRRVQTTSVELWGFLGIRWIPKGWNSWSCGVFGELLEFLSWNFWSCDIFWELLEFPRSGISGIVANKEQEFGELMDAGREGWAGNSGRDLGSPGMGFGDHFWDFWGSGIPGVPISCYSWGSAIPGSDPTREFSGWETTWELLGMSGAGW